MMRYDEIFNTTTVDINDDDSDDDDDDDDDDKDNALNDETVITPSMALLSFQLIEYPSASL